ncbi:hypothetical protein KAR91_34290 [Candidatus Pacearchaeota archaeon]|nr:hypothetical protein [Candidatus Pacearchaeota archaeon]
MKKRAYRLDDQIRLVTVTIVTIDEEEKEVRKSFQTRFNSINRAKKASKAIQAKGVNLRVVDSLPKVPDLQGVIADQLMVEAGR